MQTKKLALSFAMLVGCGLAHADAHAPAPQKPGAPSGLIQVDASQVAFKPGPPTMPKGVQLAVLEGDPKKSGIFTLRLKAPAGFLLSPHTHPVEERVTVISGSISVGFGTAVDKNNARKFEAGAFYVNPPGAAHYVFSEQGAVVQITGMGPWQVDYSKSP